MNVNKRYIKTINKILNKGKLVRTRAKWKDGSTALTRKINHVITKYDLRKGFPIISCRETNWKAAIDEILWIWQKKSNNIKDLNSKIWNSWADKDGSIGKAYGYQLGVKHDFPEGKMDQVDWVLYQLKHNPDSRRIVTNIFNHADLKEMGLQPCAYSITLTKFGNRLDMILNQRSQDFLVANNWNVVQYAVLLHMFAQYAGLKAGILTHVIADCHIYDKHFEPAATIVDDYNILVTDKLLNNKDEIYTKPEFSMICKPFYEYTVDDFSITNYNPSNRHYKLEVAI